MACYIYTDPNCDPCMVMTGERGKAPNPTEIGMEIIGTRNAPLYPPKPNKKDTKKSDPGPFDPFEDPDVEMDEEPTSEPLGVPEKPQQTLENQDQPDEQMLETEFKRFSKIRIKGRHKNCRRLLRGAIGTVKKIQTGLYIEFYDSETNRQEFAFSKDVTKDMVKNTVTFNAWQLDPSYPDFCDGILIAWIATGIVSK